ncbi:hypothetical protein K435DRAFT_875838 [Dendrothele bispora CBS 962.96]|uniref:Uncharacterized protein n=1 Tax=Dendrothele bispora (strain CBS 962.96) TaxID=1314807 RepID=A0A4S8KTV5_DENBC|nr:hypothetical protein K435DRAFT_875838 [Dendrothele bispora CBS 962.96]
MLAPPPLPPELEKPTLFLEWGEGPRRCISNQGTGSKTGEEVEMVGEREEGTRNVLDGRAQLPECYEHEHCSTTSAVPLGREQYYLSDVPRTVNRPVSVCELTLMPVMQQLGESEPNEQHKVRMRTSVNQKSAASKGPLGVYIYQHPHAGAQLLQGEGNYALRLLRPPSFHGTTSTRGSVSWVQPRNLGSLVRHMVGGFGGGDSEGSSHWSSESDHGSRNGGGGRPPGRREGELDDPDHNDDGGRSDDYRLRGGHHGKDRNDEPRCGSCGGGPLGGDPPDDGEPEGGKDGNSERSNQKDSKKRRGVTPFSEIPEEGSLHYGYEYFEYKVKLLTSWLKTQAR